MHPLALEINIQNWALHMRRRSDPAFAHVRDKIFVRDQYLCQFCGFQAREYQEVVNLNGDYRHNELSNMATSCIFCAQSLFIGAVGHNDYGGGKLIYLPEMTQSELNGFCHVLFCAMTNGTTYQETAQSIYRTFKFRSQPIEDKFGVGMSDPATFTRVLLEQDEDFEKLAKKLLPHFRLLPLYAKFKVQLEQWAISAAEELTSRE